MIFEKSTMAKNKPLLQKSFSFILKAKRKQTLHSLNHFQFDSPNCESG